jgi:hypothetical protein
LLCVLCYACRKYDHAIQAEAAGLEILQRAGPFNGLIEVLSPRMLQFVLKDNFDNFEKGPKFRAVFEELLGGQHCGTCAAGRIESFDLS